MVPGADEPPVARLPEGGGEPTPWPKSIAAEPPVPSADAPGTVPVGAEATEARLQLGKSGWGFRQVGPESIHAEVKDASNELMPR